MTDGQVRHILSLSGGKDSTALAVYMRDRVSEMEYVFCDTEKELPETYEYLDRVEAYLGKPIVRLKHDGRGFDHWLTVYGGYLPSTRMRWCTKHLKIKPYEYYVGDAPVKSYIGIRADEQRGGYISRKPNITAVYPFKEDGITKRDVYRILERAGMGLPEYYSWRSRSGCYFCFFQQGIEWVGLLENHPSLFEQARHYEETCSTGERKFTWRQRESLDELARPDRVAEIKARHELQIARRAKKDNRPQKTLLEVVADATDESDIDAMCTICRL